MANKLVEIIGVQARKYGNREALRCRNMKTGKWSSTTWLEFEQLIDCAASALFELSSEGGKIAVFSSNTPKILVSEFAGFYIRKATVPVYSSSSAGQLQYITENSGADILFVGGVEQYSIARRQFKPEPGKRKYIIIFDDDCLDCIDCEDRDYTMVWSEFMALGEKNKEKNRDAINRIKSQGEISDMATLIYTSGTTGKPKGVVLTHKQYDAAIAKHLVRLDLVDDKDLSFSFLPMSHIFEKAWCYFCITKGIRIAVNPDPRMVQQTIHEVNPTLMCSVPRFWEKVYVEVRKKIASMSPIERVAVARAIYVGRKRNLDYLRRGKPVPLIIEKEYHFWDKRVFSKLREAIGISRGKMFPTAGAAISPLICRFLRLCGINIVVGYGLSETTATVTCFPNTGYEFSSVGTSLDGIDVKISKDGEILVKSDTVMEGYYNDAQANASAFVDGYFRTGDMGYFTPSGSLVLTERLKDLFKTSNGKYIAPQALESLLVSNSLISEVAVIADKRKYVSALIVPDFKELKQWAEKRGIKYTDMKSLCCKDEVIDYVMSIINPLQKSLAEFEKIKKITLLPRAFSLQSGEITNTLKLCRRVIDNHFEKEIEAMYPND